MPPPPLDHPRNIRRCCFCIPVSSFPCKCTVLSSLRSVSNASFPGVRRGNATFTKFDKERRGRRLLLLRFHALYRPYVRTALWYSQENRSRCRLLIGTFVAIATPLLLSSLLFDFAANSTFVQSLLRLQFRNCDRATFWGANQAACLKREKGEIASSTPGIVEMEFYSLALLLVAAAPPVWFEQCLPGCGGCFPQMKRKIRTRKRKIAGGGGGGEEATHFSALPPFSAPFFHSFLLFTFFSRSGRKGGETARIPTYENDVP